MSYIRPAILIGVFLISLFVLREPLRNIDKNAALFHRYYIAPALNFFGGNHASSSDFNTMGPGGNSTGTNTSGTSTSTSKSTIGTNGSTALGSKIDIPDYSQIGVTLGPVIAPIQSNISVDSSVLTIAGIIEATNKQRTKKGLPALSSNSELNASAQDKLADMFTFQYFEHVSPTGESVSDIVQDHGYQYIVVGENLALGNFGGDEQVVTAWMNSPGHRANIMDTRFEDIGVAVSRGVYNGKEQWIAVQHFARPLSSCPNPSLNLKQEIEIHTLDLGAYENNISQLKQDIEATPADSPGYRAKIDEYNVQVVSYNNRVQELKNEIETYNAQVRSFNLCAGLK